MVRINKCILNYQLEAFRAYSKAIEGGGGVATSTSSGGASTQTSSSGGGGVTTSSTEDGRYSTTSYEGGSINTIDEVQAVAPPPYILQLEGTTTEGRHDHGIPDGTRLSTQGGGYVTFESQEGHIHAIVLNHKHTIRLDGHDHEIYIPRHNHDIKIPNHQHDIKIPNHIHDIKIPNHIHELQFGIYRGTTADKVTIKVDGKTIPQTQPGQDIDIVKYLSVDGGGKIRRNTWHTIEIIPNKMTRIVANVFMQIFTNSRGEEITNASRYV